MHSKLNIIIHRVELLSLRVPLHTPFKTALREVTHIHDLVVKLYADNGIVGFGSAPSTPQITGDDHAAMVSAIESELAPILIGASLADFDAIIEQVANNENAGSNAKAAIDIALFDAKARSEKLPLNTFLQQCLPQVQSNAPLPTKLETDYTISVNNTPQMCTDIDTALTRGYRCLKIKIGKQPQEDLVRIRAIWAHVQHCQERLAQAIVLRLDVNQGWDEQTSIHILQTLEAEGIEFELIEQPLIASDTQGASNIVKAINTPIMADESAFSLAQVKRLHEQHAANIINIKLVKTGGLFKALQIIDYCRKHKIVCMIGCMLEGSIGVAAAAHLASAHSDVIQLIDLDGPTLGQYDPIEGASIFNNAAITLNKSDGLGIQATLVLPKWANCS